MPNCIDICPIACDPSQRKLDRGFYGYLDPYSTITTEIAGISVTALQNREYPGVIDTQVPQGAIPTCDLTRRLKKWGNKRGTEGATERCSYIPGNVWITIGRR